MAKKITFSLAIIIFLSLCVVFNFYDLDISIALTKYNSPFYEFFDDFGELPIYFGPIMFGAIYFHEYKEKRKKLLSLGIVEFAYLIASVKVVHNMEYSFNLINILLSLTFSILLSVITIYLFSNIKKETRDNIKDIAILAIIVSVVSFVCVEIIKYTWGRVRFRDLSYDYSEFTKLFHINGINGNKSFPSGHTNAGTSILILSMLTPRLTNKKWIKYLVTTLCFIYIIVLAVSRIVVSAHYASDVLVGFVVGFTTIYITHMILRKRGVLNVAGNKC